VATKWAILVPAAVFLGSIHLFLFWWGHGPAKRPEYARAPDEPSVVPGAEIWSRAFGVVYSSPIVVFAVLMLPLGVGVESAAFWTLAVFIGGQLLLFALMLLLWLVSGRRHRQDHE
jgi:hypothetical protein